MKTKLFISLATCLLMSSTGFSEESVTSKPRVETPYWGGNSLSAPLGDLPATDIRAVPPAKAAAVQAKWTYFQLQSDLSNATRMLVNKLERDPEYKKALAEETDAWNKMQSAREIALAELQSNDSYVAGNHLRELMNEQLADLHDQEKPDHNRIVATALVKMSYTSDNRRLETQLLNNSSSYQEARKNYISAARRTSDMRDQVALAVAEDDSLRDLRKQIGQARIAHLSTDAYLKGTIDAANIAIKYARFHRGYDVYHGSGYRSYDYGGYYPGGIRVVGY